MRASRRSGGTRPALWRRCTSSTRPASATCAIASARTSGATPWRAQPLAGLAVVDVGCGGGLLCEPLARLGAAVTGIDLAAASIEAAADHARAAGLAIDYRVAAAEELVAERERFDLVCAMEVVEHVADPAGFLAACAALVRPGGGLVLATLNRTFRAFALGIVAAEYVLGLAAARHPSAGPVSCGHRRRRARCAGPGCASRI